MTLSVLFYDVDRGCGCGVWEPLLTFGHGIWFYCHLIGCCKGVELGLISRKEMFGWYTEICARNADDVGWFVTDLMKLLGAL